MRHLLDQLEILQQSGPSGPTVNDHSSLATEMPASLGSALAGYWFVTCENAGRGHLIPLSNDERV